MAECHYNFLKSLSRYDLWACRGKLLGEIVVQSEMDVNLEARVPLVYLGVAIRELGIDLPPIIGETKCFR